MTVMSREFKIFNLESGWRMVVTPMLDRPSVTVLALFGVGSRYESSRINGISHFIEHLLFKGSKKYPTAKDIAEKIEGVGGAMNASTDKEMTVYWMKVPFDKLEVAVDVLSDMILHSKFSPEDIERERLVIMEEIKMYHDLPQEQVQNAFEELIWPNHPLGRDIGGSLESLSKITREDILDYVASAYTKPNLVVSVAGRVDDVDSCVRLFKSSLGALSEAKPISFEPADNTPEGEAVKVIEKNIEQAHICLGCRGISYLDEDRYVLDVLNAVIGEGMSSRLFQTIREEKGLAYDIHSFSAKQKDSGYFAVYAGVDPSKAVEAVQYSLEIIKDFCLKDVPDLELGRAKEYVKGRFLLGLETTSAIGSWYGQQLLAEGRIKTIEEIVSRIESITAQDIRRVANRIFSNKFHLAIVGPVADIAIFSSLVA